MPRDWSTQVETFFLEFLGKVTTDSDFFCWIFFGAKIFSNKKSLKSWQPFFKKKSFPSRYRAFLEKMPKRAT